MRWMTPVIPVLAFAAGCGSVKNDNPTDGPVDTGVDTPDPDGPLPVWSAFTKVSVTHNGGGVHNPAVTDDGLNIYFIDMPENGGGGSDIFDIFTASRASTADDFGGSSTVPVVNVTGQQGRYVEISADGLELYYSNNDIGPIMVSTRANLGAQFTTPKAVGNGISGNFPSISADKLSLYFIAQTTGAAGELKVVTRTAVGQPFGTPTTVTLNGAVEIYSAIDISEDELSIVRAPALTGSNPAPVVISHRTSKTAPFDQNETLPNMDFTGNFFASARFANHDTEVWIGQNDGTSKEAAFVSRLQ